MRLLPLLLVGCHLFDSAAIDETCEDLKTCGGGRPDPGPDDSGTGGEEGTGEEEGTDPGPDPTDEDCSDGVDNDLDGLTDCEDEDCLDQCVEDCGDGADNDLDGDEDCADDECFGVDGCAGPYDLTVWTGLTRIRFLWGDLPNYGFDDYAAMAAYGSTYVAATPAGWDGESFYCSGQLYVSTVTGADLGVRYGGADDGLPYWFTLSPNTDDGSLAWYYPCALESLPEWDWGFHRQEKYTFIRHGGGWDEQYYAYYHDSKSYPSATIEYFPYPSQLSPLYLHQSASP